MPITGGDTFGWGVWAKVSQQVFDDYVARWDDDRMGDPSTSGFCASVIDIEGYEDLEGHPLTIHFQNGKSRPEFQLEPSSHRLACEQRDGIDMHRAKWISERIFDGT